MRLETPSRMKVIQVVPHVGNEASGPTYSVVRLSQSLAALGDDVLLMSVKDGLLADSIGFKHNVYPKARFPKPFWRSPGLYRALKREAANCDVIHSHSMWVMPNVYPGWVSRQKGIPLVLAPRGTMSAWALSNSAKKKQLFWALFQKRIVEQSACLHATAEQEYLDIRSAGFKQPVCIIPNGIDVPEISKLGPIGEGQNVGPGREVLFLGRIHPVKGVDVLLSAWSKVAALRPEWRLRIVGPGEGDYVRRLKNRVTAEAITRCTIEGPLFGQEKHFAYQNSQIYILPSLSENFGMTVAESLANATPVITTTNAPWAELNAKRCGWSIELSEQHLIDTLLEATSLSSVELNEMGMRGREYMKEKYSWESVALQMDQVYRWLLGNAKIPDCVRLD
jgi:glycosyltransferase involved in cell wall biosynthesis